MTHREFRRLIRLVLSITGALVISVAGIVLTVLSKSDAIGWLLVPGAMLLLPDSIMNPQSDRWMYLATVLNVAFWTLIIYFVTQVVRDRRHKAVA